nr:hypothetical protein HmN_000371300 [Hymenolepis microstoma]
MYRPQNYNYSNRVRNGRRNHAKFRQNTLPSIEVQRNFNASCFSRYPQAPYIQGPPFFSLYPQGSSYSPPPFLSFYNQSQMLPFYDPAIVNIPQSMFLPEYSPEAFQFPQLPINSSMDVLGNNLSTLLYACLLNTVEGMSSRKSQTNKESATEEVDGIRIVIRPFTIDSSRFTKEELNFQNNVVSSTSEEEKKDEA